MLGDLSLIGYVRLNLLNCLIILPYDGKAQQVTFIDRLGYCLRHACRNSGQHRASVSRDSS